MALKYETVNSGMAFQLSSLTTTILHRSALISRVNKRDGNHDESMVSLALIIVFPVLAFLCIVLYFNIKYIRRRRRRQQLEQTQPLPTYENRELDEILLPQPPPTYEYRQLDSMEPTRSMPQELQSGDQGRNFQSYQRVNQQSDDNQVPKIHQLDGNAATGR